MCEVVDLGGAYYNTKSQVEALEALLRKLPDLTKPIHTPPVDAPSHGGHADSASTKFSNSSPAIRLERRCTSWVPGSASNGGQ